MAIVPASLRSRRLFEPILAGASARDRLYACLGVFAAIAIVGIQGAILRGDGAALPWIAVPIGASAVLVFVVPTSPMAQPWPTIGGSSLSALIGLTVGHTLGHGALACGLAVALAIAVMSVTRSLHPPGGAMALMAAAGGTMVGEAGWLLPLAPVAMNAAVLVMLGWAFHRLSGHAYPHKAAAVPVPITTDPVPRERLGIRHEDVDTVLADLGETYDISHDDLRGLIRRLEAHVLTQARKDLTCEEIMSRDIITVRRDAEPEQARQLLLDYGVRLLPVLDDTGRPIGSVGLRELDRPAPAVAGLMSPPLMIEQDRPAAALVEPLTDGRRHAAMVVDRDGILVGLVSQADLLAGLARLSIDEALEQAGV